jgi:hypothetical protein
LRDPDKFMLIALYAVEQKIVPIHIVIIKKNNKLRIIYFKKNDAASLISVL